MGHPLPTELPVDKDINLCFAHVKLAPPLFQLFQTETAYLKPWMPWLKFPKSLSETKKMLWEQQLFNQGGQRITTFINYRHALIGMIGFTRIDKKHHLGEMGYWLAEKYQGKGIMTKCCQTFLHYGFELLGLNRIEMRIITGNERSLKLPPRLHFIHEGSLKQAILQGDQYQDLEVFGLVKEDFNTKFLFQKV